MRQTYMDFVYKTLLEIQVGTPVYTNQVAGKVAVIYDLGENEAAAATAVAIKRIMDGKVMSELRCYQKGIYYRTIVTPFGEVGINKEQLIADKYLLPDIGYETGFGVLHLMGLTTQMPRERILATNVAKDCARADKKLGVTIRPPKVKITADNKVYLQTLDVLDALEKAPIDVEQPYHAIAKHIYERKLQYRLLLALADHYYDKNTVLQLAHTASAGGIRI